MIHNIQIFALPFVRYLWGIASLLVAVLFYLTGPTLTSSYQNRLLKTSVFIFLRWGPGTGWLFLTSSFILRRIEILPFSLHPKWLGYVGLAIFFLSVVALVYDRAIASGAMKN